MEIYRMVVTGKKDDDKFEFKKLTMEQKIEGARVAREYFATFIRAEAPESK